MYSVLISPLPQYISPRLAVTWIYFSMLTPPATWIHLSCPQYELVNITVLSCSNVVLINAHPSSMLLKCSLENKTCSGPQAKK